jgi:hypothetical protein
MHQRNPNPQSLFHALREGLHFIVGTICQAHQFQLIHQLLPVGFDATSNEQRVAGCRKPRDIYKRLVFQ